MHDNPRKHDDPDHANSSFNYINVTLFNCMCLTEWLKIVNANWLFFFFLIQVGELAGIAVGATVMLNILIAGLVAKLNFNGLVIILKQKS